MELFDVFEQFEIEIVKGTGAYVWDKNGIKYLDFYGGHAVISIGHNHPTYINAIVEQLNKIGFYSNSVINSRQNELADKLGRISQYSDYSLFLVNSGAEANENALKLASFHNGKKRIISFNKGFYGRTSAAVMVTDYPEIIAPINTGLDVTFLPLNDDEILEQELSKGDVSSVIIEGIQGVGGIHIPTDRFMKRLRVLCDKYNVVLIVDEIQSGCARSGKFFAHQYSGIRPDIITTAKGIANGFPVAAVLINPIFKPQKGMLGTTFGGNHLACAAACAVLDTIEKANVLNNVNIISDYLFNELTQFDGIKNIRGRGLMIGLEFEYPIRKLRYELLNKEKVFTGVSGDNILRLLPPLTLTLLEAEEFIIKLKRIIKQQYGN